MDGVERGPDGELQWVRRAPARPHQTRVTFVQEPRRRRSHGHFTTLHRSTVDDRDDQIRRGLPSCSGIEDLLGMYVATGEGQGAFLAAKASEKTKGYEYRHSNEEDFETERRYDSRRPSHRSSADSSGSPSDGDGGPSRRRRPNYPPRPINTPGPAHTTAKRPIRPMEEVIVDQVTGSPAPPGRRRYHAHVDDVSEDEDEPEPLYADLPPHEDTLRTNTRTRSSRRRQSSGIRIASRTVMRGGGGLDDDPEEARSDGDGPNYFRLRGGAPAQPPTGMSPLSPGSDRIDTRPRKIDLFFFCTSRGKIISSNKCEQYTTFQGIRDNPITAREQTSDYWLVSKLHQHYYIINRRRQTFLWDLVSMKTIGFATFIRFERTVDPRQDTANRGYIVSARAPAISAEGEATSQFQDLMKSPLRSSKMMLFKLDQLVAQTRRRRRSFYVIQIKEAPNTTKIYTLFILIILGSTGGGVVYAVLKGDTSTGLSIASYVLTCLSLTLALVAAGQWFGLKKPNSFSFAYDVETNQMLSATYVNQVFGPNRPF